MANENLSYPSARAVVTGVGTGRGIASPISLFVNPLPTDPLFAADVKLNGCVAGTTYQFLDANDMTTVLAFGVTTVADETIPLVNVFSLPSNINIRLRTGSKPYYDAVELTVLHRITGIEVPIQQVADA